MKIKKITKADYSSRLFSEDETKVKIVRADSAYCEKCGHRQLLWGEEKYICKNCGTMVFRNDKIRFKYRLREKLIRKRRKQNGKDND
jgi:tRNA(Ile2) C34 agmatinyltransferase TiaS